MVRLALRLTARVRPRSASDPGKAGVRPMGLTQSSLLHIAKGWGQTPFGVRPRSDPGSSLALQIRQNGEDPAVVFGRRRQAELREDARHVLLDRAEGDHEPLCDRLVRTPLGHQLQYLAFAWSQL